MFDIDLKPIDKTAAIVTSKGIHYDFVNTTDHIKHWEVCPGGIVDFPEKNKDLTGKKQGRLTVIGWHETGGWLVKCVCGRYEIRKRKAINNPKNSGDRCMKCRELAYLKRSSEYSQKGFNTKEWHEY